MKSAKELFLEEVGGKRDSDGNYEFTFKDKKALYDFAAYIKSKGWHSDLDPHKLISMVSGNVYRNIPDLEKKYKELNK